MGNCFSCHKKLGIINNWRDEKHIREYGYQPPEGMSKDDKLCESCLKSLIITQVKKATESKKQTFCSKCGKLLNDDAHYCVNCGFEISKLSESNNKNKKMNKKDIIKNLTVIGIIIIILMGVLLLVSKNPNTYQSPNHCDYLYDKMLNGDAYTDEYGTWYEDNTNAEQYQRDWLTSGCKR